MPSTFRLLRYGGLPPVPDRQQQHDGAIILLPIAYGSYESLTFRFATPMLSEQPHITLCDLHQSLYLYCCWEFMARQSYKR
eukprot:2137798-Amphidinium_carterae.1